MKRQLAVLAALLSAWATSRAQTILVQPTNQVASQGGSATFSVTASGAGPFRFQWQFNGTNIPNNIITTVAGNGLSAYSGDGGPATNAGLSYPGSVAVDGVGNLFISDDGNNRVREVQTNGIIITVAGVGPGPGSSFGGYSGDGGPATNAHLWSPGGLAVDGAGNLFFPENNNHRVRKVDTNGIITTVAGNGTSGSSGDGGPATNASFGAVDAVILDRAGDLLIEDVGCNCIRKMDTNGIITALAGNGSAYYPGDGGPATNASFRFNYGAGMAFDSVGNLFIAESWGQRIRRVDTNGIITTVAGIGSWSYSGDGGPATNAGLNLPLGVATDSAGNLFIADWGNNRIRGVDTNGIIATVAGNGPSFNFGSYSGDGGPATNAGLSSPGRPAVDAAGNLFIADTYSQRIRKVNFAGSPVLMLSNIWMDSAGTYRVIVTGPSGSVTSSVAHLTVAWPTLISKVVRNADTTVTLNCSSAPNSTNLLLATTNLLPPAPWQILSTNVAAADGTWQFTDANVGNYPARYFRVLTP